MKPRKRRIFIWLGIFAFILTGLFLSSVWQMDREIRKRNPLYGEVGIPPDNDDVAFIMKKTRRVFVIPKGYLWRKSQWRGGEETGMNIEMTFPGYGPVLQKIHWQKKLNMSLQERDMTVKQVHERLLMLSEELDSNEPKKMAETRKELPNGWIHFDEISGKKQGDYYLWISQDGQYHRLRCPAYLRKTCKGTADFGEGMQFSFSILKEHRDDWLTIEQNIRNILASFEQTDKGDDQ